MRKRIAKGIFAAILISMIGGWSITEVQAASMPEPLIETRADDIRYRYKQVNGKLYKRLYNYSKNVWIGDWIPCN